MNETGIAWSSDINKKFSDNTVANFNMQTATRGGSAVTGARSFAAGPASTVLMASRVSDNTELCIVC